MKVTQSIGAGLLVFLSVGLSSVFGVVAARRPLTGLEAVFLQALSLFAGLAGSYVFGRQSAIGAAKELVRPHARSAFRRVVALYRGLSRMKQAVDESDFSPNDAPYRLRVLGSLLSEQIATADDAIEDWRDLVPEDVAELELRLQQRPSAREVKEI